MYYHAQVFTLTATGKRTKEVQCEKCAAPFFYELTRVGSGRASAPYGIGKNSARDRAERRAQKNLARRLGRDVELVPCPACRWVNSDAIRTFQRSRFRGWTNCVIVILFAAAVTDAILYFASQDIFGRPPDLREPGLWITLLVAAALTGTCKFIQTMLRSRINPNILVNDLPAVPPGTPPALVNKIGPDGIERLTPIPSEYSNLQADATWATVRPGQLVLDPLCCHCLAPATTLYKLPMTVSKVINVPICAECLALVRKKFWLRNLATMLAALLLGAVCAWLTPGDDDGTRIIVLIFVTGFAALIAFIIIDRQLRPYRMRTIDASRGIQKIAFKNPAYTALLIRRIGHADGLYEE